MLRRLNNLLPFKYEHLIMLEAGLMGLLFLQALRFLIGMLYSRTAGATLVTALPAGSLDSALTTFPDPLLVTQEIAVMGGVLALPLLLLILGRIRFLFIIAVALIAGGRVLMILPDAPISPTLAAAMTVAGGLLYIGLLVQNRARTLPYFFVIGMGAEQVFRAYGDTLDPSWSVIYLNIQMGVSVFAVLLSLITAIPDRNKITHRGQSHTSATNPDRGILTLWGAAALGSLLFLQLSLLATPNAITGRTQGDYTLFVPIISVATLLPLIPTVRKRARDIIAPFDSSTRGWMWLILLALLIVMGTRITGLIGNFGGISPGAIALAFAQLFASLTWWWIAAPQGERKRNFTGLWLPVGILIFALFVVADIFTYEYAFVGEFAPPLDTLNEYIPPLLRGFRGVGTGVMLVAVFLSITPILQYRSAIPWRGGTAIQNFFTILLVAGTATAAGFFAQPPVIQPVLNVDEIRVGTYNIHGGYDEFFNFTLPDMARTIERSGAEVVLLQDVDAGRLTSFGVDEALWLARNINNPDNTRGMDMRYYGTIEGLHGLAILSRVPIIFEDGISIPGVDRTTGLQRVQVRPDEGAVTLYNTHLGFLLAGDEIEDQEGNQRQQLDLIFATIEQHIERDYGGQLGRALLGGTFNNVPDSPLMQYLASTGFNDPFADANPILSNTLVTTQRQGRIDYLWLWEQSLRSTGSGVIDSNASEHRMAFVGIQLR